MENWCCNVLFCTNEARAFQPMGAMLSGLCDPVPGRLTGHWLGLGRFDHILVTLAKEPELLLKPEREVQCCPHASSHWACFGRVVEASFDLEAEAWLADQGVVVGVCGIKLAHVLRDVSPELEPIAAALARKLNGLEGQWLISSTTGWEDMVLIYWTHDFKTLSEVMGKVRSLGMDEIQPAVECVGVHAMLTTCTLAGIHLPAGSFVREEKRFDHENWMRMVSKRLKAGTELDWAVRFELRPGHFDPFSAELKKRFEDLPGYQAAEVSYRNVMGQYDFRVQQQRGNQGSWLEFMAHVALPLSAKEHSLARSMETHLHIDVPKFSEGSDAATEVERMPLQNAARNDLNLIETACKVSAIAPHTVEVLQATHTRLMALLGDDLQHGTFTSVENLFRRLAEGLASRPEGIAELDRSFFPWLSSVEQCLADRYRGTYPLGAVVVPRLGTYQASHHGFLTAMDCIGQHAFDYALASMNGLTASGARVPDMAVCCFIGSSPSPYALSLPLYMRSGFIELPAIMIFQLRELPVLLHEVGHLFVNAVCAHHGIVYHKEGLNLKTLEKVKTEVQEILAEMFACCACYNGNVGRYGENRDKILHSYLPDPNNRFTSSTLLISMVRLYAVHWLIKDELDKYATPQEAQTKFRSDALAMIQKDLKSHANAARAATLQGEAETAATNISYAMEVFARSRTHQPAQKKMLQAIRSLSETAKEKPGRLAEKSREADTLEQVKEFAALKTSELAADFGFIEKMVSWAAA